MSAAIEIRGVTGVTGVTSPLDKGSGGYGRMLLGRNWRNAHRAAPLAGNGSYAVTLDGVTAQTLAGQGRNACYVSYATKSEGRYEQRAEQCDVSLSRFGGSHGI